MLRELFQRFHAGARPALASVFLREGRLFVQASDRTVERTAGYWVASGPVASLSAAEGPDVIGRTVLDALAHSRVEVPVPEQGADLEAPLRRAIGARSRRDLMAGTRACAVSRERGELRVDPYHNGGTTGERRGYRPLPEAMTLRLAIDASPEAVGQTVLAALARATVGSEAPIT